MFLKNHLAPSIAKNLSLWLPLKKNSCKNSLKRKNVNSQRKKKWGYKHRYYQQTNKNNAWLICCQFLSNI